MNSVILPTVDGKLSWETLRSREYGESGRRMKAFFICPFDFSDFAFLYNARELFPPSIIFWSTKSVKIFGLVFVVSFAVTAQVVVLGHINEKKFRLGKSVTFTYISVCLCVHVYQWKIKFRFFTIKMRGHLIFLFQQRWNLIYHCTVDSSKYSTLSLRVLKVYVFGPNKIEVSSVLPSHHTP